MTQQIPVTIVTGLPGSGKAELLQRILSEHHGRRIALIGATVDRSSVVDQRPRNRSQIAAVGNGCLYCSGSANPSHILAELRDAHKDGALQFERVVIEADGLDPAPLAEYLFADADLGAYYMLDTIVALLDARQALPKLQDDVEMARQLGSADRILLTNTIPGVQQQDCILRRRLDRMTPHAATQTISLADAPIDEVFISGIAAAPPIAEGQIQIF